MFSRVIVQWFWDSYDYIAWLIVVNMVFFVIAGGVLLPAFGGWSRWSAEAPPELILPVGILTFCTVWAVVGSLMGAVYTAICTRIRTEQPLRISDMVAGLKALSGQALGVFGTQSIIVGALLLSVWFYGFAGFLPGGARLVGYFLSGVCFWATLLYLVMSIAIIPMVMRGGVPVALAHKRALRFVVLNPGPSLGVAALIIVLWMIGLGLKLAPAFLLTISLTATLINSFHNVMVEVENPPRPLPPPESAPTWREREELERLHERRRMDDLRYRRTMKDILKPWDT